MHRDYRRAFPDFNLSTLKSREVSEETCLEFCPDRHSIMARRGRGEETDADWREPEFQPTRKKSKSKKQNVIATPMCKEETWKLLNDNHDFIKEKHDKGWMPMKIANALCIETGRPGAVTNKQISNWLYHKKKSGWLKTYPVSQANQNLRADKTHQAKGCMYDGCDD